MLDWQKYWILLGPNIIGCLLLVWFTWWAAPEYHRKCPSRGLVLFMIVLGCVPFFGTIFAILGWGAGLVFAATRIVENLALAKCLSGFWNWFAEPICWEKRRQE